MNRVTKFGDLDDVDDIPVGTGTTPDVVGSHLRDRSTDEPTAPAADTLEMWRAIDALRSRVEHLERRNAIRSE